MIQTSPTHYCEHPWDRKKFSAYFQSSFELCIPPVIFYKPSVIFCRLPVNFECPLSVTWSKLCIPPVILHTSSNTASNRLHALVIVCIFSLPHTGPAVSPQPKQWANPTSTEVCPKRYRGRRDTWYIFCSNKTWL